MALYFKGLSSEFSAVMAFVGLLPLIVWKKLLVGKRHGSLGWVASSSVLPSSS